MGALKSVNNIGIYYQIADFDVETPGYWKLRAHNDFDNGDLVKVNGVPMRDYHHKQILKLDFSKLGDAFTDSIRMTLTNLLNETFVTLFAENQAFISAVTPGSFDAPLTYSLQMDECIEGADKCIFIIEDSQLDIGLLIAVERNVNRIFQIVADYLVWNDEQIAESIRKQNEPEEEKTVEAFNVYEESETAEKKKGFFGRIADWFKGLFKKKGKDAPQSEDGLTPKQRKKAERERKKAEKKAAREEKKAKKQAEREAKEAQKTAVAEAPAQETAEEESAEAEPVEEAAQAPAEEEIPQEDVAEEVPQEDVTEEVPQEDVAEEEIPQEDVAEEEILQEDPAQEEISEEAEPLEEVAEQPQEQIPAQEQSEVEVSDNE